MRDCFILLCAGKSKRFKSKINKSCFTITESSEVIFNLYSVLSFFESSYAAL